MSYISIIDHNRRRRLVTPSLQAAFALTMVRVPVIAATEAVLAGLGRRGEERVEEARSEVGTLIEGAASLLTEGEWTPSPEPDDTNEESP